MKISIYQLKPAFQRALQPLVAALARAKISPNQLTLATLALCLSYGLALLVEPACKALWLGFAAFQGLRMALNALDGLLATHTGQKTRLGAVLNELCDQLSDAALYLPFAFAMALTPHAAGLDSHTLWATLVVLVVILAGLTEFCGVLAHALGQARSHAGPMGKSDRAAGFALLALLIGSGAATRWQWACLGVIAVLLVLTIVNRTSAALAQAPLS
jgi:CDP-diacylglycerol---glycerol-3-phosphate 3-phosphatidyltransferase